MPTSYGTIPTGQVTPTSRINTAVQSSGTIPKLSRSNNSNHVRVTAVYSDGSISYESLDNNLGKSSVGSPTITKALLGSNNINSIPYVGELVEIYSGPNTEMGFNKNQAPKVVYYRPASLNVWNNQNNNVVLDPTVEGSLNDDKMANLNLNNYQNSLNGFV
jgi:hypothetical protein